MPDILVQRGSASSQGPDVTDPLLTTDQACMARGRAELDSGSGTHPLQVACVYRDGLLLGALSEEYDPLAMRLRYGKITSITHNVTKEEVVTTIHTQVPSEFVV